MNILFLKSIFKKKFLLDIITLSGGTAIAQAVILGMLPVLTRLYSPSELGLLHLYISIVTIFCVPGSLKLERSIILPENDEDARCLVAAIFFNSLFFSILLFLFLLKFSKEVAIFFKNPLIEKWLFAIPFSVFMLCTYEGLRYYRLRNRKFKKVGASRIAGALAGESSKVLLGYFKVFETSMVAGLVIGQNIMHTVHIATISYKKGRGFSSIFPRRKRILEVVLEYRQLVATLLLSQGVAQFYNRLPTFAISSLFGSTFVGFWSLAERAVGAPIQLISNAVGDVFFQRASAEYNETGKFSGILLKTLCMTTAVGIPIYSVGIYIAPYLFGFVFGEEWRIAGEYASILLVGGMFSFIMSPVDKGAIIVQANRYIILWHFLRFMGKLLVVFAVISFDLGIKNFLWGIVAVRICLYCFDLIMCYRFGKGR